MDGISIRKSQNQRNDTGVVFAPSRRGIVENLLKNEQKMTCLGIYEIEGCTQICTAVKGALPNSIQDETFVCGKAKYKRRIAGKSNQRNACLLNRREAKQPTDVSSPTDV